jgi:hypothetical protein
LFRAAELARLGLRELRSIEPPSGTPDDVWLGVGLSEAGSPTALVSTRRAGAELYGWARVAAHLAGSEVREVFALAPAVRPEARDALRRLPGGPRVRLVSTPALAEQGALICVEEPNDPPADLAFAPASALHERVLRALEGAAVITDSGGVRRTEEGFVVYVRGVRVVEVLRDGDGIRVNLSAPERQRLFVTESNFPRFGPELHELIVRLAQDPRLIDAGRDDSESAMQRMASGASARIVARWMPWDASGEDPIDWTGVDERGRPTLGWSRESFELSDVPAIAAALRRLDAEREAWAPGSSGRARVIVAASRVDPRARSLISALGADLETADLALEPRAREGDFERRRRRGRRRRGRRGEELDRPAMEAESRFQETTEDAEPADALEILEARDAPEERLELVDVRSEIQEPEANLPESPDASGPELLEGEPETGRREAGEGRRRRSRGRRGGRGRTRRGLRGAEQAETDAETEEPAEAPASLEEEDLLEPAEMPQETVVEGSVADESDEGAVAELVTRPLRRRPRAALCVRNDPDTLLAALILARERRHVSFFYVCSQEQLMDFFRGKATDLEDNTDLLLVGFTAQPVPKEVIAAAGLYRGRIEWFDHHEWPIEDLEMLRDSIGREAIALADAAASPLAAVMSIAERRSRFTDKLIDLAGRRLSEADMERWGYRLMGLLHKMAASAGDHRAEVVPILTGRPTDLPEIPGVYDGEQRWLEAHDPRIVHFGEYWMAVVEAPSGLDAGELGRRARQRTGARLSLASREGDDLILLGCNEEKRHINVLGLVDQLAGEVSWLHARAGGDRVGRIQIEGLSDHPERLEQTIGQIVRHKSLLHG